MAKIEDQLRDAHVEAHVLLQELEEARLKYRDTPEACERIRLLLLETRLLHFENQGLRYGLGDHEDDDD